MTGADIKDLAVLQNVPTQGEQSAAAPTEVKENGDCAVNNFEFRVFA